MNFKTQILTFICHKIVAHQSTYIYISIYISLGLVQKA